MGAERAHVHGEHLPAERMIPGEHVAQSKRKAQHPLPDGHGGEHVVDEVRSALRHAAAPATRTHPARFARKRYEPLGMAGVAAKAREALSARKLTDVDEAGQDQLSADRARGSALPNAHSGANPCRIVFSLTTRGSTNCSR